VKRDLIIISLSFFALGALYWLAMLALAGEPTLSLDDAYIHLRFARNLVEHGEWAFNPGQPSSGSTSPGFVALLALAFQGTRDWLAASFLVTAACGLGCAWMTYALVRQWTADHTPARWAGLLVACSATVVVSAWGGMESNAYALLFLVGLWSYGRGPRGPLFASVCFALAVWLRPEMLVMAPLVIWEQRREGVARLGAIALIWALVVGAYSGFHLALDGQLLPSTFGAKAVVRTVGRSVVWDGVPAALRHGNWAALPIALLVWPAVHLVLFAGMIALFVPTLGWRLRESARDTDNTSGARLAVRALVVYVAVRAAIEPAGVLKLLFQHQRYHAHLIPVSIALLIWAAHGRRRVVGARDVLGAVVVTLLFSAFAAQGAGNIREMHVELGRWIGERSAPTELVAANDIGAIGFYSDRSVLDTVGLVEPELVEHLLSRGSALEYLDALAPEWIVVFPNWLPGLDERSEYRVVHRVQLERNAVAGASQMVVYRRR